MNALNRTLSLLCFAAAGLALAGCQKKDAKPAGAATQAMPVQTATVSLSPVPQTSEYVATIKSRRTATLQPQVDGKLTRIRVRSGDHVKAGQPLMDIDPQQQLTTVEAQKATERQKKALYDYNVTDFERQRKLFDAGVTSRQAFDQSQQALANTKADYESSMALKKTAEAQLAYYTVRAPFSGVVGDIPVHVGDYATPSTALTTVDENKDLEAYVYIPTERAAQVRMGLDVEILDNQNKVLEQTRVDFISPEVDSSLQGILVKAPVHSTAEMLRNAQLVKVRVVWATAPMAIVPVLAISRQGGQSFVYVVQDQGGKKIARQVAITLGDTVGNSYAVSAGLNAGDKVIVSSTQFLINGMPVVPMGG
jgi:RND family efflux transporter MFP subunit